MFYFKNHMRNVLWLLILIALSLKCWAMETEYFLSKLCDTDPSLKLKRLVIKDNSTLLEFEFIYLGENDVSVFIAKAGVYITDVNHKKKYRLLRAEGIPVEPNKHIFKIEGQTLDFRLIFEKIDESIKEIQIFEEGGNNSWKFYSVKLTGSSGGTGLMKSEANIDLNNCAANIRGFGDATSTKWYGRCSDGSPDGIGCLEITRKGITIKHWCHMIQGKLQEDKSRYTMIKYKNKTLKRIVNQVQGIKIEETDYGDSKEEYIGGIDTYGRWHGVGYFRGSHPEKRIKRHLGAIGPKAEGFIGIFETGKPTSGEYYEYDYRGRVAHHYNSRGSFYEEEKFDAYWKEINRIKLELERLPREYKSKVDSIMKSFEVQKEYKLASATNTIQAYKSFLEKYPSEAQAVEAHQRIKELEEIKIKQKRIKDNQKRLTRNVQEYLTGLNFEIGVPDGKAGKKTISAVKKFQAQQGLLVDGKITKLLLKQLDDKQRELFTSFKSKNSIAALDEFVAQYPKSKYVNDAISLIYTFYQNINTEIGYEEFMKKYPNNKLAENASKEIFNLRLKKGTAHSLYLLGGKYERSGDITKAKRVYEYIIENFSESDYAIKANDNLLTLSRSKRVTEITASPSRKSTSWIGKKVKFSTWHIVETSSGLGLADKLGYTFKRKFEITYIAVVEKEFGDSVKVVIEKAWVSKGKAGINDANEVRKHARRKASEAVGETRIVSKSEVVRI